MKKFAIFFSLFVFAVGIGIFSGCGGAKKPDGLPELIKQPVTVTQDGKPLAGVHLTLYLAGEGKNWPVFGDSDSSGKVIFNTQTTDFKGAPAGDYIVTAEKVEVTPSQFDNIPVNGANEAMELEAKKNAEYRPSYYLVDPALKDKETTTLTLKISASGCEPSSLDLGPACREMFIPPGSAPEPNMEPEPVDMGK